MLPVKIDSMTLLMGSIFAPFYVMLADFQADGRLPMVNGRVKGQRERKCKNSRKLF